MKFSESWIAAKTSKEDENLWLPLSWHLLDTAAVMDYLVNKWLPAAVYHELGMKRTECRKYAHFLALVHDLGKATPAFQRKILPTLPDIKAKLEATGFEIESTAIAENFKHAHAGAVLLRSTDCSKAVAAVVGAHHGKPESNDDLNDDLKEQENFYSKDYGKRGSVWEQLQKQIITWALNKAGYNDFDELPEFPDKVQMLFSGLVIMADWISSNPNYFPLISIDRVSLLYDEQRIVKAINKLNLPEPMILSDYWQQENFFIDRFDFAANSVQKQVQQVAAAMKTPGIMILEAPMGVGKTEAALSAAEILINRFQLGGIAFFLPSQATTNAMFSRLLPWLEKNQDCESISVQLAHGNADLNEQFVKLFEKPSQLADDIDADEKLSVHSFFMGRKTKLLSTVVTGTVDQLLMAALKQKHIMLRHLGLAGKIVIIDECHAYDAYMNVYLDTVLQWLGAYKIPVILLSATLPGQRRQDLISAYAGKKRCKSLGISASTAYPLLTWADREKVEMNVIPYDDASRTVVIEKSTDDDIILQIKNALNAGGCVGIILNTVKRVQMTAELIKKEFPQAEVFIDHSQFLMPDRLEHEDTIMQRVGKTSLAEQRKNVVVIGSQVLEQSLDLDFDLLITDLCPMDLLLQRIGRLHRHKRVRPDELVQAKCVVLNADETCLEAGAKAVYGEYILLRTCSVLPEKVILPQDISPLVQKTYNDTEGKTDFPEAFKDYEKNLKSRKQKARQFRLNAPEPFEDSTIVGLLDDSFAFDDVQAQAAVRDGVSSLEVIVVRDIGDNTAVTISGSNTIQVFMNRQPSKDEAKEISRQRLRLPVRFSQIWNIENTIKSIEEICSTRLKEWLSHPQLNGELIVILDKDFRTSINETILRYDADRGLLCEEDEDV